MLAEIICIGDEILIGQVVNTNATFISKELNKIGIEVLKVTSISDDTENIKNSLKSAMEKSDLVLITGGLGPTHDDVTKKALLSLFDCKLFFLKDRHNKLEKKFNKQIPESQSEILEISSSVRILSTRVFIFPIWRASMNKVSPLRSLPLCVLSSVKNHKQTGI